MATIRKAEMTRNGRLARWYLVTDDGNHRRIEQGEIIVGKKKIVYEINRVENFLGDRESIVFHLQGDPYSFDTSLAVENIKPGNPYETEQSFIDYCVEKAKFSGVEVINNVKPKPKRLFNITVVYADGLYSNTTNQVADDEKDAFGIILEQNRNWDNERKIISVTVIEKDAH